MVASLVLLRLVMCLALHRALSFWAQWYLVLTVRLGEVLL